MSGAPFDVGRHFVSMLRAFALGVGTSSHKDRAVVLCVDGD